MENADVDVTSRVIAVKVSCGDEEYTIASSAPGEDPKAFLTQVCMSAEKGIMRDAIVRVCTGKWPE
jgi:hypothetical protein